MRCQILNLFITGQSGMFAGFSGDAPQTLLAATQPNHHSVGEFTLNSNDGAFIMHTAMPREVTVEIQQVRAAVIPKPSPQPVVESKPPPTPPQPKPIAQIKEIKPAPVFLDVTVLDRDNHPVVNLENSDFSHLKMGCHKRLRFFQS